MREPGASARARASEMADRPGLQRLLPLNDFELDGLGFLDLPAAVDRGGLTYTSSPPPSCAMKPKPFSEFHHFTMPVAMPFPPYKIEGAASQPCGQHSPRTVRPGDPRRYKDSSRPRTRHPQHTGRTRGGGARSTAIRGTQSIRTRAYPWGYGSVASMRRWSLLAARRPAGGPGMRERRSRRPPGPDRLAGRRRHPPPPARTAPSPGQAALPLSPTRPLPCRPAVRLETRPEHRTLRAIPGAGSVAGVQSGCEGARPPRRWSRHGPGACRGRPLPHSRRAEFRRG